MLPSKNNNFFKNAVNFILNYLFTKKKIYHYQIHFILIKENTIFEIFYENKKQITFGWPHVFFSRAYAAEYYLKQ